MIRKVFYIRRKARPEPLIIASLDGMRNGEGSADGFIYSLSSSVSAVEEANARRILLERIDRELSIYMQNRSYVRRFLISSLVFLAVYFFCSFVIRDPLPIADELIAGLAAAVFSWMIMKKRDYRSIIVSNERGQYCKALEEAEFSYESGVRDIEEYLDSLLSFGLGPLAALAANDEVPEFMYDLPDGFAEALEWHVRHDDKLVLRYADEISGHSKKPSSIQKSIIRDASTGLLDVPLLALYLKAGRKQ